MATEEEELEGQPVTMDSNALALITGAEIDVQIATARKYPRDLQKVKRKLWDLIGVKPEDAADCIYALPRGKEKNERTGQWEQKVIKGPTVRFAESVMNAWGNCRSAARVVNEEQDFVTAQGIFHDLESNVAISIEVRRRITDREGRRYNADMIVVTANAACGTALRNAILRGVPQPLWKGAYEAAQGVIAGTVKTLADRREAVIKQFGAFSMTQGMCLQVLGLGAVSDITLDHLIVLQGMLTALQSGDATVETLMQEASESQIAEKGQRTVDQVKQKYPKRTAPPKENPDAEPPPEAQEAQKKLDDKRRAAQKDEGW